MSPIVRPDLVEPRSSNSEVDDSTGRRIEEWIVSTIDDRASAHAGADWEESLVLFDRSRVSTRSPRPSTRQGAAAVPRAWGRFRLARRRGVAVVTLTDAALIREDDVVELAGDLVALVESGHRRLVIDFATIERLSTWAASALAESFRCFGTYEGGAVKVVGLGPEVAAMLALTGLDQGFAIEPDVAAALAGSWPARPDLLPLPVSILAALIRGEAPARARRQTPPAPSTDEGELAMTGVRLIAQEAPWLGRSVVLSGQNFVIGRGSCCHLRIPSARVSRSHAAIERRGGRLFLRDLASTNGTLLNGQPLRGGEAEIREDDRIAIGPMTFAVALALAPLVETHECVEEPPKRAPPSTVPHDEATEERTLLNLEESTLLCEIVGDVLVATPLAPRLDDDATINAFRDALQTQVDRGRPNRVVVNLAHVGYLSSRAIGVMVAHHLKLGRVGGALRVCLAGPRVAVVLEQVRLGMLMDCHATVEEAVLAAWPGGVEVVKA